MEFLYTFLNIFSFFKPFHPIFAVKLAIKANDFSQKFDLGIVKRKV